MLTRTRFADRKRTGFRWLIIAVPLFLMLGCKNVEFYQREALQDEIMLLDQGESEAHWYQKCFYSREGAVGGIGSGAGGGCGCY